MRALGESRTLSWNKERMYEQKNMVGLPSGEEVGDHGGTGASVGD